MRTALHWRDHNVIILPMVDPEGDQGVRLNPPPQYPLNME